MRKLIYALPALLLAANAQADHALHDALIHDVQVCKVPDPTQPSSAFDRGEGAADANGDYPVNYACKEVCDDWRSCVVPAHNSRGEALYHGRDDELQKQALAFVTNGLGGHLAWTTDQTGDQTVLFHTGGGGTNFGTSTALAVEERTSAGTVMIRWDNGFVMESDAAPFPVSWGWYSRSTEEGARVPNLNKRVASAIAWVHAYLAGPAEFGTAGCSMGAQATFGSVFWHGLDDIIDYQMFGGGPPLWDINAGCGRRSYDEGFCDVDASVACTSDAACQEIDPGSFCRTPAPIPFDFLYEGVVNHVHATQSCDISAATAASEVYGPFDESSIAFTEGDWEFDHPVDFVVDIWGELNMPARQSGGDINWSLGHFMRVFDSMTTTPGNEIQWHAFRDSHHCDSFGNGDAANVLIPRMGLK